MTGGGGRHLPPSLYVKTGPGVDYDYMDDVFSCSTIIKMIRAYSVRPVDT